MTVPAISRRINISAEVVHLAIQKFLLPDNSSRTPSFEGRRLERIRESFGWIILNYKYYRDLRNEEARREYMREYMRVKRDKNSPVNSLLTPVNSVLAVLANTEAEAEAYTKTHCAFPKPERPVNKPKNLTNPDIKLFVDYAFETFGAKFDGEKLNINGGKDGKIIKRLLGTYDLEKLKKLWDKFIESEDEFIKKTGVSIGVFSSQINKLISSRSVENIEKYSKFNGLREFMKGQSDKN